MGYYFQAFIGNDDSLNSIQEKYNLAKIVQLERGISMIPLTQELFYQINGANEPKFVLPDENLIEIIEERIMKVIARKKLAYIEASFFGGEGGQMGIIWANGSRHLTLEYAENRINEVLRDFGVQATTGLDEFETIGLDSHRNTRDW